MQHVEKKKKKNGSRMMQTGIALLVLCAVAAAVFLLLPGQTPGDEPEAEAQNGFEFHTEDDASPAGHSETEITAFSVALDTGERWSARPDADGLLVRSGDASFYADPVYARLLLLNVNMLESQTVVAEDFTALADRAAEFGLDAPRETVSVTYTDGVTLTAVIGGTAAAGETARHYMLLEGRPELFVADDTVWKELYIEAHILRPTDQPTVHASRIDRVTLTDAGGTRAWALDADIADPDAADRWSLIQPYRYAADSEAMGVLKKNLENLRMGTWVAEATPDARTAYGFDAPRAVITAHMAAGTVMATGTGGAAEPRAFDAGTFTVTLGDSRNDMVDYVLWEDAIYTMPHWMVSSVLDTDPLNTLTRYPVLTSLSNLKHLTVETPEGVQVWIVTRTERVAENNALETDATGRVITDVTLTLNGEPADWDAFSVRYNRLLQVTVSGVLPADWAGDDAPPHTVYTFETETGAVHDIALTDYDAFADAVWVDGAAVFYMKKGALALTE